MTQARTNQVGQIPLAFLVLVVFVAAGEYALRNTRAGWQLRATGSDEELARRIGLRIDRIIVLGYVGSSLFAALGDVMLMVQIGVVDPRSGLSSRMTTGSRCILASIPGR